MRVVYGFRRPRRSGMLPSSYSCNSKRWSRLYATHSVGKSRFESERRELGGRLCKSIRVVIAVSVLTAGSPHDLDRVVQAHVHEQLYSLQESSVPWLAGKSAVVECRLDCC
jgi:hypothetical protein